MKRAVASVLFFCVLSVFGCAVNYCCESKKIMLANNICNNDIAWDGDFVGLSPRIIGVTANIIAGTRDSDYIGLLIPLLADKNKYVVAHVLLTQLSCVDYERNASSWNKLSVDITDSRKVLYLEEESTCLLSAWRKWIDDDKPKSGLKLFDSQNKGDNTR